MIPIPPMKIPRVLGTNCEQVPWVKEEILDKSYLKIERILLQVLQDWAGMSPKTNCHNRWVKDLVKLI